MIAIWFLKCIFIVDIVGYLRYESICYGAVIIISSELSDYLFQSIYIQISSISTPLDWVTKKVKKPTAKEKTIDTIQNATHKLDWLTGLH